MGALSVYYISSLPHAYMYLLVHTCAHTENLDDIYEKVVASKEAAIDSEGIRLLSSIGREQVETTHGELIQFDTVSYAEKLVTFMGGRRGDLSSHPCLNWEKLGERAAKAFRRAPVVSFL